MFKILSFIKGFPLMVWLYLGAFVTVVAIMIKIYKAGGDAEAMKRFGNELEEIIENVQRKNKITQEVNTLDAASVDEQLRDSGWLETDRAGE